MDETRKTSHRLAGEQIGPVPISRAFDRGRATNVDGVLKRGPQMESGHVGLDTLTIVREIDMLQKAFDVMTILAVAVLVLSIKMCLYMRR